MLGGLVALVDATDRGASPGASQADLAVSILTAADMRRIDLAGVDASRNAVARGYWSASKGLLIAADRLPARRRDETYQVWLIGSSSAGPVSAGLMEVDRSRHADRTGAARRSAARR